MYWYLRAILRKLLINPYCLNHKKPYHKRNGEFRILWNNTWCFLRFLRVNRGKTPLSTSPRVISGHLSGLRNLCVDWDLGVALSSAWDGVPWRARCTAWKINMEPEKNRGLEEFFSFSITVIFRFHVNFADCCNYWSGFLFGVSRVTRVTVVFLMLWLRRCNSGRSLMKWTRILPCKLWVEKSLDCLGKGGEVDTSWCFLPMHFT